MSSQCPLHSHPKFHPNVQGSQIQTRPGFILTPSNNPLRLHPNTQASTLLGFILRLSITGSRDSQFPLRCFTPGSRLHRPKESHIGRTSIFLETLTLRNLYRYICVYIYIHTSNKNHISLHGAGPGPGPGPWAGLWARVPCHLSAQGAPKLPELSGAWLEFLEFQATSALKAPRNSRNSQAPG